MKQTKLRVAKETRLEVFTRERAWIAPTALLEQIARGRFDARRQDVRLILTGEIRLRDGQPRLEFKSPVSGVVSLDISAGKGFPADQLDALSASSGAVEVTGLWRPASGEASGLVLVTRWRPVEKPASRP